MSETTESAPPGDPATPPSTPSSGSSTPDEEPGIPAAAFPPSNSGNRALWLGVLFLIILLLALLIASVGALRHWFALHTGTLHGGPDVYYNFWSGFGSDLGEATLISAVGVGVYTGVRKVNCHTKGCWRIGHHSLEGTPYILCKHHHPEVPNRGATHEDILAHHRRFKAEKAARHPV